MNTIEFLTLDGNLSVNPNLVGLKVTGEQVDTIINNPTSPVRIYIIKVLNKIQADSNAGLLKRDDNGKLDLTNEIITKELMEVVAKVTDQVTCPDATPFQKGFYFAQILEHTTMNIQENVWLRLNNISNFLKLKHDNI